MGVSHFTISGRDTRKGKPQETLWHATVITLCRETDTYGAVDLNGFAVNVPMVLGYISNLIALKGEGIDIKVLIILMDSVIHRPKTDLL